ncbi:MAG: sigma-54-dependent Fis family transcriptional regulator [Deltaproteobacteria bacterium]|nr:sigma-54-dependent Fis family transcriptional regulator [Deltaproteobacteria bacterium]
MLRKKPTVLVVDDDVALCEVLVALLEQDGFNARKAISARAALAVLDMAPVDVMITDLRMPGMDGMELLERTKQSWPELPVLMLTAHGAVDTAVEAIKKGAAGFLLKPFDREQILYEVRKALSVGRAREELPHLREKAALIGDSAGMAAVWRLVERAASCDAHVLVRGESGTGKELVVEAVHARSGKAGPLVKVNCAALPDSLIEDELFGHEKGAFTGALTQRKGRVELAEEGTLFLDEIGDISPVVQVKLLRLLQERQFERLGGTKTLDANVRFITATHCDLEAMVRAGTFRKDLYFRLDVVPIEVPPLREHVEDIPSLCSHFLNQFTTEHRRQVSLSNAALRKLGDHTWPGNVRELRNVIERLVVLADEAPVSASEVEHELRRCLAMEGESGDATPPPRSLLGSLDDARQHTERQYLERVLTRTAGNRTRAARLSGVSRRTFYNLLERHSIA